MLIRFRASEKRDGQEVEFPLVIRQQILNYMDHLVQRGKLVKIVTPVKEADEIGKEKIVAENVSFKPANGVNFDKQFIVTDKGDSVLIDDALTPTDLELCTPTWFLTNSSRVSLEKFGLGSQQLDNLGLIYNEALSDALRSITYDQLDPNSLLRITLPTVHTGENMLLPKGFTRNNVNESVRVFRSNALDNTAVQDLANFNHLQKEIYTAATQALLHNARDSHERFSLQEIHRIAMDGSEQRRIDLSKQINTNLTTLTDDITTYDKQLAELNVERNAVPRTFHRRQQRGTLKDHDTHKTELAVRKQKKDRGMMGLNVTGALCASIFLLPIGVVAFPFTGTIAWYKNYRYNLKKWTYAQGEILRDYPVKLEKIESEKAIIQAEVNRYENLQNKLVNGVQIEIEESLSISSSSSGFYSRRNPANMASSSSSSSSHVVQGQPVRQEQPEMQEVQQPEIEVPSKMDLC